MIYKHIKEGRFIDRPNRFIAHVEVDGEVQLCHVKNTGRCRELLIPGSKVFVQQFDLKSRKTAFDLISVYKGSQLINMDSQAPNRVVQEWLQGGNFTENITLIKPETTYGTSRFDFYIEADEKSGTAIKKRKIFMEVKGVTLEENGVAMFPDAPTERGVKHLRELAKCIDAGFEAYVFFVIQMGGVRSFTPNRRTHEAFAEALAEAGEKGVNILVYDCKVTENSLCVNNPIPLLVL